MLFHRPPKRNGPPSMIAVEHGETNSFALNVLPERRKEVPMQSAVLHGARDLRIEERPRPTPQPGEVLVKTKAVGICGSDLHYYEEGRIGPAMVDRPMVMGHEIAAEIVDERASDHGLQLGALAAVDPAHTCGHCEWCARGFPNLCVEGRFLGGPSWDGGLSEYLAVPAHLVVPVPTGFSADEVALLEPLGVAIHALDIARLRPLRTVAVIGAGPIGLLLLQVARACGALETHVVEPLESRRSMAKQLGADSIHERPGAIAELTHGRGVDMVLEATNSPEGLTHAAETAKVGGRIVVVGIPRGDGFDAPASLLRNKGLSVRYSHRMGDVYHRAIELVRKERVLLAPLATHHYPLSDAGNAFEDQIAYANGAIKTMITM